MAENLNFEHEGLPCRVVLTSMGHFCGYVGVPEGHPWHGRHYNDTVKVPESVMNRDIDIDKVGAINLLCASLSAEEMKAGLLELVLAVDVHGGLTYSQERPGGGDDKRATWWLGFDCAHRDDDPAVQDCEYTEGQCRELARQIAEAARCP